MIFFYCKQGKLWGCKLGGLKNMHTVKVNKQAGKAFDLWGLLISKISFSNFPTTAALWTKNPEKSLFAEKIITTLPGPNQKHFINCWLILALERWKKSVEDEDG